MSEEIVKQYRVKKKLPRGFYGAFFAGAPSYLRAAEADDTIEAGEIGFSASADKIYKYLDGYLFKRSVGKTLFVRRKIVERWDAYFEPLRDEELENECSSCAEGMPTYECRHSKRPCGHHCNHSWSHDKCCWCGTEFGEQSSE